MEDHCFDCKLTQDTQTRYYNSTTELNLHLECLFVFCPAHKDSYLAEASLSVGYTQTDGESLPIFTFTKLLIPEDKAEMTRVVFDVLDPHPDPSPRQYSSKKDMYYRAYVRLRHKKISGASIVNAPPILVNFGKYPTQKIHTNSMMTVRPVSGVMELFKTVTGKLITVVRLPEYYTSKSTEVPITIESKVEDEDDTRYQYQFFLIGAKFSLERFEKYNPWTKCLAFRQDYEAQELKTTTSICLSNGSKVKSKMPVKEELCHIVEDNPTSMAQHKLTITLVVEGYVLDKTKGPTAKAQRLTMHLTSSNPINFVAGVEEPEGANVDDDIRYASFSVVESTSSSSL